MLSKIIVMLLGGLYAGTVAYKNYDSVDFKQKMITTYSKIFCVSFVYGLCTTLYNKCK